MPDEVPTLTVTKTEAAVPLPENDAARVKSTFNENLAAAKEEINPTQPEVVEPVKVVEPKTETAKPADGKPEMPDEIITGKKTTADDVLLNEKPPEHLKGAARQSFEKQQQQYNERITRLREERDALAKEKEELAAKYDPEVVKSRDAALEALKAEKARADEHAAALRLTAFERTPEYQSLLKNEQAEIENAKTYIEGAEIDPNVIALAAQAKGPQRIKILRDGGIELDSIGAIVSHLSAADRYAAERTNELANSGALLAQREAQQEQQRQAMEAQAREEQTRIFGEAITKAKTDLKPFRRVEGNDAWNQQITELESTAQRFFNGKADLVELAHVAVKGVAYDVLDTMVTKQAATITELKAELGRLKAAQPTIDRAAETKLTATNGTVDQMAESRALFNRNLEAARNGQG